MMNKAVMDTYLEMIEKALERYLSTYACKDGRVLSAMRYATLGGGKRVRALLVLNFCRICGGAYTDALPLAAAVEMVHAYSLIHDDLPCMDDDDLRRGKPSCHKAFDEATALLAGDGLLTLAFHTVASSSLPASCIVEASRALSEAAGINGMIGGQELDIAGDSATAQELTVMCMCKTGALIKCAAKLGCIAAGAKEERLQLAEDYAGRLGLCFQVTDDLLDVIGQQDVLGKPIGSDAQQNKTTFATLLGVLGAQKLAAKLTAEALTLLTQMGVESEDFLYELTQALGSRNK